MIKLKPGMAVHCDTKEKSDKFLKECEKQGIVTASGNNATTLNVWNQFKDKTCYGVHEYVYSVKYEIGYCHKEYYKEKGFDVIEFDDLFKGENLMNLKVGDKVRVKKDLKVGIYYKGNGGAKPRVVPGMNNYKGKIATIKHIDSMGFIVIDLDEGNYFWSSGMFEEIEEEKVNEVIFNKPSFIHNDVEKVIRNGNVVIVILDTGEKGISKLHPDDKFDLEVGYEIAYQRATIERLKREIKDKEFILDIKLGNKKYL